MRKYSRVRVKLQTKVSFLICGTQKGGTTALADYLRLHPELHIPARKELHFFDNESHDWLHPPYWQYHRCCRHSHPGQLWGDATPITMWWDPAPARIWRYNPSIRLVVCLRNPISRAYSHWSMEHARGKEPFKFDDALMMELSRSRTSLPSQDRRYSYVDRGYYVHQIKRLWRFFGKESVLILRQEDLLEKPRHCLNKVCDHLGVHRMPPFDPQLSRVGVQRKPMSSWARQYLHDCFDGEISTLQAMLGWDCNSWLRS